MSDLVDCCYVLGSQDSGLPYSTSFHSPHCTCFENSLPDCGYTADDLFHDLALHSPEADAIDAYAAGISDDAPEDGIARFDPVIVSMAQDLREAIVTGSNAPFEGFDLHYVDVLICDTMFNILVPHSFVESNVFQDILRAAFQGCSVERAPRYFHYTVKPLILGGSALITNVIDRAISYVAPAHSYRVPVTMGSERRMVTLPRNVDYEDLMSQVYVAFGLTGKIPPYRVAVDGHVIEFGAKGIRITDLSSVQILLCIIGGNKKHPKPATSAKQNQELSLIKKELKMLKSISHAKKNVR
jgi:hypothetical protein